jgi:hypothetical protein
MTSILRAAALSCMLIAPTLTFGQTNSNGAAVQAGAQTAESADTANRMARNEEQTAASVSSGYGQPSRVWVQSGHREPSGPGSIYFGM